MRREKSLRNSVHHANAVVWGPVYRTHLTPGGMRSRASPRAIAKGDEIAASVAREALSAASESRDAIAKDIAPAEETLARVRRDFSDAKAKVRSIHWSPYDRVGVVNAVP